MTNNQTTVKLNYAAVGAPISHELAGKEIKDFCDANPDQNFYYTVGRNIIEKVLNQPGCVGIRIFKALNAQGAETLIYAGVDQKGETILYYSGVGEQGKLVQVEALIGNRPPAGGGQIFMW